jgi:hypothetical protein
MKYLQMFLPLVLLVAIISYGVLVFRYESAVNDDFSTLTQEEATLQSQITSMNAALQSATVRLTAVDGSKERRWQCDNPNSISFGPPTATGGDPADLIHVFTYEPQVVVRTIGLVTPQQLGYENCTLIPPSLWSVTVNPQ